MENLLVATFLFIILTKMVATRTPKTLNGEITIGGMRDGYRLVQSHMGFFSQISRTDISEGRARDGV